MSDLVDRMEVVGEYLALSTLALSLESELDDAEGCATVCCAAGAAGSVLADEPVELVPVELLLRDKPVESLRMPSRGIVALTNWPFFQVDERMLDGPS